MLDSVRSRLTLWYIGVLALVLLVFSIGIYALLSRSLHARADDGLRSVIEVATKSLINDTEEGQSSQGAAESTVAELFNKQQALAIFDGSGKLLAGKAAGDVFYARLPNSGLIPDQEASIFTAPEENDDDDEYYRVAVQRVSIPPLGTPYIILASQPMEMIEDELASLREILYYAVPAALVLASLGGWFIAHKSLAPLVAMSEQARRIGAENLGQRLPVANSRDELGRLATAFNELLARLDASFAQQRQFMADASHELRTPLFVMHTAAEVTLKQPCREEKEYRDAIKIMDEQTRRLTRIVKDMFTLARADAGRYPLRQRSFYLDELLEETARAGGVLAANKKVMVEVADSEEAPAYGDEDLLRQMILNLLDNAIKNTPPGGAVRASLTRQQEKYVIEIADSGPGIPLEARPHIFERFYRADKARSRAEGANGGAGLGLAIARWVAEAHSGSLELTSSGSDGSTFIAAIPATARK